MRSIYSIYGNQGVRLDPETRLDFLRLLGVEDGIVHLWKNPLRGDPIPTLYLMTECCPIPANIQSIVDRESLIEHLGTEEPVEEPHVLHAVKEDLDEESTITHSFLKGNRGQKDRDLEELGEIQLPEIPDSDVGTELEMVPPLSLSNEEILSIFKRENCAEDGKCREVHFFIGTGTVVGEKRKEHKGIHIFPSDPIAYIETVQAFRSLLNKAMLAKLKKWRHW